MSPPHDTPPGPRAHLAGTLWRAADVLAPGMVVLALLVHPTQVTVRDAAGALSAALGFGRSVAAALPAVNATVSDALLLAAFLLWLVLRGRQGLLRERLCRYPAALLGLLVCALLSIAAPLKPPGFVRAEAPIAYGRAARQFAQLALLFGCAYLVMVDCLSSERWRRRALAAFFVAVGLAVLVGLSEYARLRPAGPEAARAGAILSPHGVDATFGFRGRAAEAHEQVGTTSNRNVLGAWLTLVVPLLWAAFLFAPGRALRWAALPLTVAGGLLLLHGGLWLAALVAVLALSFVRGRVHFAATAAGIFLVYGLVFAVAPQRPGQILLDSVMLRRSADRFRTLSLYDAGRRTDGAVVDLAEAPYSPWEQKYVEWQPALLALSRSPLFGLGLGNYQLRINAFYSDRELPVYRMPKSSENLMEPGGNAFYAVWLVETGFVGLLGFIWLVFEFLRRAARGVKEQPDALARCLKLGACAALGASVFGCLFVDYWVRGVGIAYVFVLSLASASCGAPAGGTEREDVARDSSRP